MIIDASLLIQVRGIAQRAGAAIMEVYAEPFDAVAKGDGSPVTQADLRAEALITPALLALDPQVPVVAEEAASRGEAPGVLPRRFWLVDPLDGTREFVSRNGEFTVNIALVEDGLPLLGVVFAPALGPGHMFSGIVGQGAWRGADDGGSILCRAWPGAGAVALTSRSHGDAERTRALLAQWGVQRERSAGSSLKFCLVAAGEADVYPRFGRTMEWDTAAGHAVLRAAGGEVFDGTGQVLRYGKPGFENPDFIARGQPPWPPVPAIFSGG
jgi:3'(2'), 5'-bisphosphate nucleotidase